MKNFFKKIPGNICAVDADTFAIVILFFKS